MSWKEINKLISQAEIWAKAERHRLAFKLDRTVDSRADGVRGKDKAVNRTGFLEK